MAGLHGFSIQFPTYTLHDLVYHFRYIYSTYTQLGRWERIGDWYIHWLILYYSYMVWYMVWRILWMRLWNKHNLFQDRGSIKVIDRIIIQYSFRFISWWIFSQNYLWNVSVCYFSSLGDTFQQVAHQQPTTRHSPCTIHPVHWYIGKLSKEN